MTNCCACVSFSVVKSKIDEIISNHTREILLGEVLGNMMYKMWLKLHSQLCPVMITVIFIRNVTLKLCIMMNGKNGRRRFIPACISNDLFMLLGYYEESSYLSNIVCLNFVYCSSYLHVVMGTLCCT